ncbi:MAG: hypothetical protein QXS21_05530 [Thermoproteota archaeon]
MSKAENNKKIQVRKIYRNKGGNVYLAVGRVVPREWKIVKITAEQKDQNTISIVLEKLL